MKTDLCIKFHGNQFFLGFTKKSTNICDLTIVNVLHSLDNCDGGPTWVQAVSVATKNKKTLLRSYLHKWGKSLFCHTLNFYQIFQLKNNKSYKVSPFKSTANTCCEKNKTHTHNLSLTFSLPTFVKWPWISLQPKMSFAFLSPICCRPFSSLREPVLSICRIFCLECSSTDVLSWDSQAFSVMFSLPSRGWEKEETQRRH